MKKGETNKINVAIIGTVGLPANYGGFETLAENLVVYNSDESLCYTVYCSSKSYSKRMAEFCGAKLKYVGLKANGWQSVIYDAVSIVRALRSEDVVVAFGTSGSVVIPFVKPFTKKKIIIHTDGIEYRREKWGRFARWYIRLSERMAVRFADVVVVDNQAVADYIHETYGVSSPLIEFGGDNSVFDDVSNEQGILSKYGLKAGQYAISICRIEPENNVEIILDAFRRSGRQLLFVGNWEKTPLGVRLLKEYSGIENIKMAPAVYDKQTVYVLRRNAEFYVHGHSAGGTNPSLVEAMYIGLSVVAFDVVFNRETTEGQASYFDSAQQLSAMLSNGVSQNGAAMKEIADRRYKWNLIVDKFVGTLKSLS